MKGTSGYSAIIVGTGFSGICLAIKLKNEGINDFIILEKADDLGGTWRENTYPGAECDIPSALYSFSFEPYPYWEYKWSHQPQILDYLKFCAKKYDIYPHIHFNKEMVSAHWNENESQWKLKTKDGKLYKSKLFVTAIGQLHHPSFPNLGGINRFKGESFHSAKWDHNVSLEGKTVGVIGNAASAVQFIPQIAKTAAEVIVFQRTPNWMLPKQDRMYKKWEKSLVKKIPFLLKLDRLRLWLLGGGFYFLMVNRNRLLRKYYEQQTKKYINKKIQDPELREKLVPDYPLGAKRILLSDDYYEALDRKNVNLVTERIDHINEKGLVTQSEKDFDMDILIFATGFKSNPFLLGLDIRGNRGITIKEAWKDGPINYLGMTVSDFPNMFLMYGPNTNLGHNSILIMCEAQANYISQCAAKMKKNNWQSIEVKKETIQKYYQSIQSRLRGMIWTQIEDSWYKSENGNVPNNWPGRTMEYMKRTKKVDFSAYQIS